MSRRDESEYSEFVTGVIRQLRLRRTAYLMCGYWHLAGDAAQDALVRVYVAWPKLAHRHGLNSYAHRARSRLKERPGATTGSSSCWRAEASRRPQVHRHLAPDLSKWWLDGSRRCGATKAGTASSSVGWRGGSSSQTPGFVTPSLISTTASSPTLTGPRVLAEDHAGVAVLLHAGASVRVVLRADFVVPGAEGTAVTRTAAAGGFPSGQPIEATFIGLRPGRADLVSMTDYLCLHSTPRCSLPQQIWRVHVLVID